MASAFPPFLRQNSSHSSFPVLSEGGPQLCISMCRQGQKAEGLLRAALWLLGSVVSVTPSEPGWHSLTVVGTAANGCRPPTADVVSSMVCFKVGGCTGEKRVLGECLIRA